MANRKFKSYSTFSERLKKLGILKSGSHCTLLYNTFVTGDSKIYADTVERSGLLEKGEIFKEWRDRLVKLHILDYSYDFSEKNKDKAKFSPGYVIIDLINKELLLRNKIATEEYVNNNLKNYVTKEEMYQKIYEAVKITIETLIPPYTGEKHNKVLFAIARKNEGVVK